MKKPKSRWPQTLLAALLSVAMLLLCGRLFIQSIASVSTTIRSIGCASGYRTLDSGQQLKHHPNGCGWVPVLQSKTDLTQSYVDPTAYIGSSVIIRDNARVDRGARISGATVVAGSAHIPAYAVISDGIVAAL